MTVHAVQGGMRLKFNELHPQLLGQIQLKNWDDILHKAFEEDFKKSKDCLMIADKIFKSFSTNEGFS